MAQFVIFPLVGQGAPHAGMVAAELFLLWLAGLMVRLRRWIPEDVFLLNAVTPPALWATLPAACGAAVVATQVDQAWSALLRLLAWDTPVLVTRLQLQVQLVEDLPSAVGVALAVVLLPAVCEEAFFRGFVFTGLRYHHGPWTAVIGSALLFAAAHFNPWQFPVLFLLGLFLGLLVHWTHSLYPSLLAHALNNALSVVGVNLRAQTGLDWFGAVAPLPLAVLALGALALGVGVRRLRRTRPLMPVLAPSSRPAPADGPAAAWR